MSRATRGHRPGFTLIELLVVISIIALLVSVLLPALEKSRFEARRLMCKNNVRQMTLALYMYANDDKSRALPYNCYPGTIKPASTTEYRWLGHWMMYIAPYMQNGAGTSTYTPSARFSNYAGYQVPAMLCPETRSWKFYPFYGKTYGMNTALTTGSPTWDPSHPLFRPSYNMDELDMPLSLVPIVGDSYQHGVTGWGIWTASAENPEGTNAGKNHNGDLNIGFLDGHVESLARGDRNDLMMTPKAPGWQ